MTNRIPFTWSLEQFLREGYQAQQAIFQARVDAGEHPGDVQLSMLDTLDRFHLLNELAITDAAEGRHTPDQSVADTLAEYPSPFPSVRDN